MGERNTLHEVYDTMVKLFMDDETPVQTNYQFTPLSLDGLVTIALDIAGKVGDHLVKTKSLNSAPPESGVNVESIELEEQSHEDVAKLVVHGQDAFDFNDLVDFGKKVIGGKFDTGNATLDIVINTLLKYGRAFGKVKIFDGIMKLVVELKEDLMKNNWLGEFAAKLVSDYKTVLMGLIINFFSGNRHHTGILGLLENLLVRLVGTAVAGELPPWMLALCGAFPFCKALQPIDMAEQLLQRIKENPDEESLLTDLKKFLIERRNENPS